MPQFADSILNRLPPAARQKLVALRQTRDDAHAMLHPVSESLSKLRLERQELQHRLDDLTKPKPRMLEPVATGRNSAAGAGKSSMIAFPEDHPMAVAARRDLTRATAALEHAEGLHQIRRASWSSNAQLVRALEDYLGKLGGVEIAAFDGDVKSKFRGTIADAVEQRRRRLRELKADARRVAVAPRPSAYCRKAIGDWLDELAERGAPRLLPLIEQGRIDLVTLPEISRSETFHGAAKADGKFSPTATAVIVRTPDVMALMAWLDRDRLQKRLLDEIDNLSDDDDALTDDQRAEAFRQIAIDRLAVEREEEALIEQAASQGQAIARRTDAEGVVFTTAGHPVPGSEMEKFLVKYKAKYGHDSETAYNAVGYDLIKVIEAAVTNAGSLEGPAIKAAIDNLENVQGATAQITYKGSRGIPIRPGFIVAVEKGKRVFIKMSLPDPALIPAPHMQ